MTKHNHIIPVWYIERNLPTTGPCYIYKYCEYKKQIIEDLIPLIPNAKHNRAFWRRKIYLQETEDSFAELENNLSKKFKKYINIKYLSTNYDPKLVFEPLDEMYILCLIKTELYKKGIYPKLSNKQIKMYIDKTYNRENFANRLTGKGHVWIKVIKTIKPEGYIFGDAQIMKFYLNQIDKTLPNWVICTILKIDKCHSLAVINDPTKKTSNSEWNKIKKCVETRINDIMNAYTNHILATSQLFIVSNIKRDTLKMKLLKH